MKQYLALGVFFSLLILSPAIARGDGARGDGSRSGTTSESGDALIARGIALRRAHDNEGALRLFQLALDQSPSARAHAHVALAQQALGQWLDAERGLQIAVANADDPWILRHRSELEGALRIVKEHLASLFLDCETPGAELLVDGEHVALLQRAEALRVVIGHHAIVVRAEGFQEVTEAVDLRPHEERRVHLRPRPVVADVPVVPELHEVAAPPGERAIASAPIAASPIRHASFQRTMGFAVLGAAVVELAVGAIYGAMAIHTRNSRDQSCYSNGSCSAAGVTLDSRGRSQAAISTVAFTLGFVGAGAGTYLVVTAPSGARPDARNVGLALGGAW